jgi:hypothetical protein
MEQQQATAAATPTAAPAERKKIRSICVDTLTAIMKSQVYDTWEAGKALKHDDWKDYGVELNQFVRALRDRGFTLIGVLGYEGSGKSFGMKSLDPGTNVWFNCDDKETTFKGGRQVYGTRTKPTQLNRIADSKSYDSMLATIDKIIAAGALDANPIAFLIAHIEDYKSGEVTRQRMKVMGKVSKNGLEDMLTMCYYTKVSADGYGGVKYELLTQNTGLNTGRTMEGQHEGLTIPNDFKLIINSFDNY